MWTAARASVVTHALFCTHTHTHIQACNDERDLFTNSLNKDLFNLFLSPCFLKLWDLRPFFYAFRFLSFFTQTLVSKNVNKCDIVFCVLCLPLLSMVAPQCVCPSVYCLTISNGIVNEQLGFVSPVVWPI